MIEHLNFNEEENLYKKGYGYVVGIDEVGRGPLAGPVFACAACLISKINIEDLGQVNDSKKLSEKKREELYKILTNFPNLKYKVGKCSEKEIDKINIKNASELAMERAVTDLQTEMKIKDSEMFLLIDGNQLANLKLKNIKHKLIIKGDSKVFSIAAASIIAKVERDNLMKKYHKKYPQYGFDKHKGYPTKFHKKAIEINGILDIHRKTFKST